MHPKRGNGECNRCGASDHQVGWCNIIPAHDDAMSWRKGEFFQRTTICPRCQARGHYGRVCRRAVGYNDPRDPETRPWWSINDGPEGARTGPLKLPPQWAPLHPEMKFEQRQPQPFALPSIATNATISEPQSTKVEMASLQKAIKRCDWVY